MEIAREETAIHFSDIHRILTLGSAMVSFQEIRMNTASPLPFRILMSNGDVPLINWSVVRNQKR